MSEPKTKVRLISQVKVGGRWIPAGDQDVTAEELEVLKSEGLLADAGPEAPAVEIVRTYTQEEFEAAVAITAQIIAEAMVEAAVGKAVEELQAERNELKAQLRVAHEKPNQSPADAGEAGAADAMTSPPGGAAAPADQNTPPSEKASKTAQKKGAAATTKG